MKKIKVLGLNKILEYIKQIIDKNPLHISFDLKVFENKGLTLQQLSSICKSFTNNLVSIDITEFNPSDNDKYNHLQAELARECIINSFNIKEKELNIYNEDSNFLIYRPMTQKDPYSDIGWYVLRGMNKKLKERILKCIPNDTIISLDNNLVTKTTINKQNNKSFYTATSISDTTLLPKEKLDMYFELIN